MKPSTRTLPVAALLLVAANADSSVAVDGDTTTVYFPTCPTALTTTTTLSSTLTWTCPGGQCPPGGPTITPPPMINVGPAVNEILDYTTTLPNGDVEVLQEFVTVYSAICSGGSSIGAATYSLTQTCPCEAHTNPTAIPSGFTTTVTSCDVCHNGGPTTMTMTVPCTTGPYASVTPEIGPTGVAAANAQAAATAGTNAAANAGSGSASSDSSGSGSSDSGSSGSGANAAANADANAAASAQAGGNTGAAGANSASNGNSAAGANSAGANSPASGNSATGANSAGGSDASANAAANAAASAQAGAGVNSGNRYDNGTGNSNNTISPPITPAAPGSASGAGSAMPPKFTGSGADKLAYTVSGVLAVAIGSLAFML